MDTIAGILAVLGFVVLITSTVGGGKRDRRYKTGHRDNVLPTEVPFSFRVITACVLWGVAVCLMWPFLILQLAVVGVAGWGIWLGYPKFYSKYKGDISTSKFLAGRLTSCLMLGILLPLYVFQLLLPSGQALLPPIPEWSTSNAKSEVPKVHGTTSTGPPPTSALQGPVPASSGGQAPASSSAPESAMFSTAPVAPESGPSERGSSVAGAQVSSLLQAAASANWTEVDRLTALMKASSTQAERGDRKSARASNTEGLNLLAQQQYEAAINSFAQGVQTDPADVELLNNLGYAYVAANRSNDGIKTLERLLINTPDRSSAWANMSEGYAQLQSEKTSVGALRLAVRFSASRDKTIAYLKRTSEAHPQLTFRAAAASVLQDLSAIPSSGDVESAHPTSHSPR